MQQLLARKTAQLGSALTRRVAAGEVVAVSTGDVEKIGWFVEAVSRFAAAAAHGRAGLRRPGRLPARARRRRRRGRARAGARRAAAAAPRHPARRLPAREGGAGHRAGLRHRRRAAGAARHRRRGALPRPLPPRLPGGPPRRRAQRPDVGADLRDPGAAAGSAADRGRLVRRPPGPRGPHRRRRTGHRLQRGDDPHLSAAALRGDRHGVLLLAALRQAGGPRAGAEPVAEQPATRAEPRPRRPGGRRTCRRSRPESAEPPPHLAATCTTRRPGCSRPAGRLTAVVCGDPDAAGRLAERLGGHPASRRGDLPVRLLGGVPLDELPLDTARTAVLVQDKDPVLLSGTLPNCSTCPPREPSAPRTALAAAQCADVLDALAQASVDDRGPDGRPDHRTRPLPVRRPAPAARAGPVAGHRPGGAGAGRADLRRRLAHRGPDRRRLAATAPEGARPWCFTSSPLLLDRADRVVLVHEGEVAAVGGTASCCTPSPATGPSSPARPTRRGRRRRTDALRHGPHTGIDIEETA